MESDSKLFPSRSKVKKFKKVDGDDFFPIVCCLNNCKQK